MGAETRTVIGLHCAGMAPVNERAYFAASPRPRTTRRCAGFLSICRERPDVPGVLFHEAPTSCWSKIRSVGATRGPTAPALRCPVLPALRRGGGRSVEAYIA